ncbi:DUF1861 family protein [Lachnospiraceae bacterium OttesenSCG-928-D06]|nr:DUF1861 family protein [Lachnospiraceae bacterium OttesenSCG-928-D06]
MLSKHQKALPATEAFEIFQKGKDIREAVILKFEGVDGCDVYNPSIPFKDAGKLLIAGRVEERGGHSSKIHFFENKHGVYYPLPDYPIFDMEDPFLTYVDGTIVFGGVKVEWANGQPTGFKTVFYKGNCIKELRPFAEGPTNMKDIRLCELKDGRIAVFTRPRDFSKLQEWGSLARIGFTVIKSLDMLNPESILDATLLEGHFTGFEWGGVNHAFLLKNGLIGVVGHRSWGSYTSIEVCDLHYYGMAFAIHPDTLETTESKIIISRDCFPEAPAKLEGLKDVTFTAGIERNINGTATVYSGLSDAAIGRGVIPDPFLQWENLKV